MILCVSCRVSVAVEEGRMFHVSVISGDSLICTGSSYTSFFKLNVKLPPSKSWYGTLACVVSAFFVSF